MGTNKVDTVFVLGAGFSHHAGLPLQSGLTQALLKSADYHPDEGARIVSYLRNFVSVVFGHKPKAKFKYWPELEDIFTCIDLSANAGHYLDGNYAPSGLRTVRRALIAQIILMIRNRYHASKRARSPLWRKLDTFFHSVDLSRSAFICINWDTVVEERIAELRDDLECSYCCDAISARFPDTGEQAIITNRAAKPTIPVIKVHGSVNWLYCDNCRRLLWFPPNQTLKISRQLLSKRDWDFIDEKYKNVRPQWMCPVCPEVPLGTRLATFSYEKALDFPMFQKSWFSVENHLRKAENWVFFGYSLPAADFEFKYLLKRVQLSKKREPRIVVITGGTKAEETCRNYQRFFGVGIGKKGRYFKKGLNEGVFSYLESLQ